VQFGEELVVVDHIPQTKVAYFVEVIQMFLVWYVCFFFYLITRYLAFLATFWLGIN